MQKQLSKEILAQIEKGLPPSWYYIGPSWKTLKPKKINICSQEILIYRALDQSQDRPFKNKWIGMGARCLHMNADLSCGKRRKNSICCPMHQWTYDENGFIENLDGIQSGNSHQARLKKYEVIERFGQLFVFLGEGEPFLFPLEHLESLSVSPPIEVSSHAPLYLQCANGFDINHFPFVHGRKVEKILSYNQTQYTISIKYNLKNISPLLRDRILKFFFDEQMTLDYTVFGGNIVFAKVICRKKSYTLLTFVEPLSATHSKAFMFSVTKKSNFLKNFVQHFILNYFIKKFFMHEVVLLDGVSLKESGLPFLQDPYLVDFFFWYNKRIQFLSDKP